MSKKPPITNVTSGFSSTIALNNNFTSLRDGFDNTLSLDGSTPNAMQTELDLANNNIINVGSVETDTLFLGGVLVTPSGLDPAHSGAISPFGASLIDDVDAAAARTTLGLGTAATSSTTDFITSTTDFITKTNDSTIEDNVKVKFGTDNNLEIFHDGSNSYIKETGTGNLIIDTDGSQLQFKSGTDSLFEATVTGGVNLHHNNVSKFQTYSGGVNVTGVVNATSFVGDGSGLTGIGSAGSTPSIDDNGTGNTVVTINSQPNGGSVLVGTTSLSQSSTDGGLVFFAGGGVYIKGQNTNYTSTVSFIRNGNVAGTIGTTGTSVSYNTSSDYRLKEDWSPMVGASERIQSLNPVNFAWKLDGSRVDGFLAHELFEVVPESVTGSKDAVDENGVAEMQGVDQSKLVPLLTAGLQEALTEISSLKARVQALEGS